MGPKIYAVLTGDVVGFSDSLHSYKKIDRDYKFIDILHHKLNKVANLITQEIKFPLEAYRGDSFQLVLSNPYDALSVALALRSALISSYPFKDFKEIKPKRLQLRIAIGLGTIEYFSSSASKSDGEAFRKSGPFLDTMKGKKAHLSINTPWKSVNDELDVETALIDAIMNRWTIAQSEAMMYHFAKWTQNHIAGELNISQPAVRQRIKNAGHAAIKKSNERYKKLLEESIRLDPYNQRI